VPKERASIADLVLDYGGAPVARQRNTANGRLDARMTAHPHE